MGYICVSVLPLLGAIFVYINSMVSPGRVTGIRPQFVDY